jgi:hypothetical protein
MITSSALSLLKNHEKDAGKVVYSAYATGHHRSIALAGGADFVLDKIGENYDEYILEVEKAAKIGLNRRISRRLTNLGYKVNVGRFPSGEQETELLKLGRSVTREKTLNGDEDGLTDLLKRRGWWGHFDLRAYSDLAIWERLGILLKCAGVTEEELAKILGAAPLEAKGILVEHVVNETLEHAADELLSVLAYVMRLARYEPSMMPHYWNSVGVFQGSYSAPPWDSYGLSNYLKESGASGIEDSLFWIRSH